MSCVAPFLRHLLFGVSTDSASLAAKTMCTVACQVCDTHACSVLKPASLRTFVSFETCISSNVFSVPHCDPQVDFFFAPAFAVSRGIGVEIHGMVKAGQLEPPFPQVSKRMPIDIWDFEALLRGNEGKLPGPYAAIDIEM